MAPVARTFSVRPDRQFPPGMLQMLRCFRPKTMFLDPNPSGRPVMLPRGMAPAHWLPYPSRCGKCSNCRVAKGNEWATRIGHECKYAPVYVCDDGGKRLLDLDGRPIIRGEARDPDHTGCATLTFAEMPPFWSLDKEHVRDFIRRLRRAGYSVRYFAVGEYGTRRFRPHYHVILWGLPLPDAEFSKNSDSGVPLFKSETLTRLWGHGMVEFSRVDRGAITYLTQYILKSHQVDDHGDTGEVVSWPVEPFQMPSAGSEAVPYLMEPLPGEDLPPAPTGTEGAVPYLREHLVAGGPITAKEAERRAVARYRAKCRKARVEAWARIVAEHPLYRRSNLDPFTGDPITPDWQVTAQFHTMSTHPAIGAGWYARFSRDAFPSGYVISDGRRVSVPEAYRKRYRAENAAAAQQFTRTRLDGALADYDRTIADNQPERLAAYRAISDLKDRDRDL